MNEASHRSPGTRALTAGLVLTVTLVGFESLAVATAVPAINAEFPGGGAYGWVIAAYMIGNLAGIVGAGRVVDGRGPLPPFLASALLFGGALVLASLAPDLRTLIAARLLQGAGGGGIAAVAYATIARAYVPEARSRIFAILSTAWVVPGAIGPGIAAFVTERFGYRAVFSGIVPLVALAIAMTAAPLARVGSVRPAPARGSPSAVSDAARLAIVLRGIQSFAFFGIDACVPPLVHDVLGGAHRLTGLALTSTTLAWTAAAWIADRHAARVGTLALLRVGFSGVLLGGSAMGAATQSPHGMALAFVGATVAGFGVGLGYGPLSVVVLGHAPEGQEGRTSTAMNLTEVVAIAMTTALGGALIDAFRVAPSAEARGVSAALGASMLAGLVGLAAALRLRSI